MYAIGNLQQDNVYLGLLKRLSYCNEKIVQFFGPLSIWMLLLVMSSSETM